MLITGGLFGGGASAETVSAEDATAVVEEYKEKGVDIEQIVQDSYGGELSSEQVKEKIQGYIDMQNGIYQKVADAIRSRNENSRWKQ